MGGWGGSNYWPPSSQLLSRSAMEAMLPWLVVAGGPGMEAVAGSVSADGPFPDASRRNYWQVDGIDNDAKMRLAWRVDVVGDIAKWPDVFLGIDHLVSDDANVTIQLRIYDTGGTLRLDVALSVNDVSWQTKTVSKTDSTLQAGTWTPGERFTVEIEIEPNAGADAKLTAPQAYV